MDLSQLPATLLQAKYLSMFRNTAVFPFCSHLALDWPIALPSLTASVLSRPSWDSQEGETRLARQEGRWVWMPSPPPRPGGKTVSFAFTSRPLRSLMASRAFQSESIDGMARQQVGRGGGWLVGLPASANPAKGAVGGRWACLLGARPPWPWRGHHHRLSDSSQSSSDLPRVRSHFLQSPSLSGWILLTLVVRGFQVRVESEHCST